MRSLLFLAQVWRRYQVKLAHHFALVGQVAAALFARGQYLVLVPLYWCTEHATHVNLPDVRIRRLQDWTGVARYKLYK